MPDTELPGLTEDTAPASGDMVLVDTSPGGGGASRKMSVDNLFKAIAILSSLSAPATGDELGLYDASAAATVRITLANLFTIINSFTEDTTPVSGDFLVSYDTSASAVKKVDFARFGGKSMNLPITAAHLPDDTSGSAAAQINSRVTSDASDPQVRWIEALFDDTTDEHLYWQFAMPLDYVSSPILDVYYKAASATSGTASFNATLKALTAGDATDADADEFAGEQTTGGTGTVPATAGYMQVISITLVTADSVAAKDWVVLGLLRDVSVDTVTGDLEVVQCLLRYS